jgi:hypothetical protein
MEWPPSSIVVRQDAGGTPLQLAIKYRIMLESTRAVLTAESSYIGEGRGGSLFERLVALGSAYGRVSDPIVRQRLAGFYTCERL